MYYSLYNYYIYIGLVNFHGKTIMIVSLLVPFVSSFIQPKKQNKNHYMPSRQWIRKRDGFK